MTVTYGEEIVRVRCAAILFDGGTVGRWRHCLSVGTSIEIASLGDRANEIGGLNQQMDFFVLGHSDKGRGNGNVPLKKMLSHIALKGWHWYFILTTLTHNLKIKS